MFSYSLILYTSIFQTLFHQYWTNSESKEKVREIVGPILNKVQTGLEDVPTCHNQLIEELTLANLFLKFQTFREDLQKQDTFLKKGKFLKNDTHHAAVHESYQTATLEHKLTVASLDKFKNIFRLGFAN